jgi:hypothetical protein
MKKREKDWAVCQAGVLVFGSAGIRFGGEELGNDTLRMCNRWRWFLGGLVVDLSRYEPATLPQ